MIRYTLLALSIVCGLPCAAQPDPDSARIAELLAILRDRHFAPRSIDDRFSADVYDAYLRALDPDSLFLANAERNMLASDRLRIDDQLSHGVPAFVQRCDSFMHAGLIRASAQVSGDGPYAADDDVQGRWLRLMNERCAALQAAMHATTQEAQAVLLSRMQVDLQRRMARGRQERIDLFLATLASVHDAQSTYLSPEERTGFGNAMTQAFVGVGVALTNNGGHIRIEALEPGGPAMLSGALRPGDELLSVHDGEELGVPVVGMSIDEVVHLLRGPEGSAVELHVRKADGAMGTVPLQRTLIHPDVGRAQATLLRGEGAPQGLITLPRFYTDLSGGDGPRCSKDVSALLDTLLLAGIEGVVVDLRDNQGGSMSETIALLGLFLDPGPVAQRLASDGTVRVLSTSAPQARYRGPLVVLVNARSASASEFFAAALQDHRRAVIMGGTRTYGKGTIQTLVDLSPIPATDNTPTPAGSAKLTVGLFFRPSGRSVQWEGITPDIVLSNTPTIEPTGERALPYALKHDDIAPCTFTPCRADGVAPAAALERARDRSGDHPISAVASPVRAMWSPKEPATAAPLNADDQELIHALLLLQDVNSLEANKPRGRSN